MNGPIPTIAFMFSATHSVRPRPRSSFSEGRGVDMGVAKRPKHIRCMGRAKAWFDITGCRTLHGFCEGCGFFLHAHPSVREEGTDWNGPVGKMNGGIRKPAPLNTARVRHPKVETCLTLATRPKHISCGSRHIRCMGGAKAWFEFTGCRTLHGFCEGCGFCFRARPSMREEGTDWNRPVV